MSGHTNLNGMCARLQVIHAWSPLAQFFPQVIWLNTFPKSKYCTLSQARAGDNWIKTKTQFNFKRKFEYVIIWDTYSSILNFSISSLRMGVLRGDSRRKQWELDNVFSGFNDDIHTIPFNFVDFDMYSTLVLQSSGSKRFNESLCSGLTSLCRPHDRNVQQSPHFRNNDTSETLSANFSKRNRLRWRNCQSAFHLFR